jgi:hypothetical protein
LSPTYDRKADAHRRMKALKAEFRPQGSCAWCGSTENLQWDHIDPATKEFDISYMCASKFKRQRIIDEIKKCRVLCGSCNTTRRSKVSQHVIDQVREADGTLREIAERFGISATHVSRVKRGLTRRQRVLD